MNDFVEVFGMVKFGFYVVFGDKEVMFEKFFLYYFDCYGDIVFGLLMCVEKYYFVDICNLI